MPRDAGNPFRRFVRAIASGDGFSFGTPRMSDGATALVLPVLRSVIRPRRYVLAEEVAKDLRGRDPGRIDRVRVRNETGSRVFLRPGLLLRGSETPSRGTTTGVLMDPRSTTDAEVRCVQASQPVSAGAELELSTETAPDAVHRALLLRDQGLVWASVAETVDRLSLRGAAEPPHGSKAPTSDDLVGALSASALRTHVAEGALAEARDDAMQCGTFILNTQGVMAAEVFDSPESWRVVSRAVQMRYAPYLRSSSSSPIRAEVAPETAVRLARDFLSEISEEPDRRATEFGSTAGRPFVEYTALKGEVIHLVAFRLTGRSETPRAAAPEGAPAERLAGVPTFDFARNSGLVSEAGDQGTEEADVAVVGAPVVDLEEDVEAWPPPSRPPKRKILTSGWDSTAFQALERYARKEFRGDRSAAMRFLVRQGLRRRGYFGPDLRPRTTALPLSDQGAGDEFPATEPRRAAMETRVRDLERIVQTAHYAGWLRQRAQEELERLATADDEFLRDNARIALGRIVRVPGEPGGLAPEATESPPPEAPTIDVSALLRQAATASTAGRHLEALELLEEILESEPFNITALLGRAVAFRRAGKAQEALAGLDLVLRLDPRNAAALLNRGRIFWERGNLEEAANAFDRLVEAAPNDWDVWMERGDVLLRLGRDEEALRSYAEALRRNPGDEKLQRKTRSLERSRELHTAGTSHRATLPHGVEEGQSYLSKERRPDRSYRVFKALVAQKLPGLLITRQSPERVRQDPGLVASRVIGLGHAPGPDVYRPEDLASLSQVIGRFLGANRGRGVILLDGLESLIAENGFRSTVLFVEHVNELVLQHKAIFLLPVPPDKLTEREQALLERNVRILS